MNTAALRFARGYIVYASLFIGVVYPVMIMLEGSMGMALFHLWPITTLLLVKPLSNIQHPLANFLLSAGMLVVTILSHVLLIQNVYGYSTFGFSFLFTPLAVCFLLVTAIVSRALARKAVKGFVIGYGFYND